MNSIRASKSKATGVLAVAAASFLFASAASAHDTAHYPITGDSLKMSSSTDGQRNGFKFKTKGQININAASVAESPVEEGGTLTVRGTGALAGDSGVIHLDPKYWSVIGKPEAPKGWKFKGAPYYTDGVTKVLIKSSTKGGSLQIQAKDFYWPFQIVGAQDSVQISLSIGTFSFCAQFSSFITNEEGEIEAEASSAPTECPAICGNAITETGEQCDDGNLDDADTCTNICEGCAASDVEYASTYEAIQQIIFDSPVYGCTSSACHGSSAQHDLDLRDGVSYDLLVGHATWASYPAYPDLLRVSPGDKDKSLLYLALAKKAYGSDVVSAPVGGMPDLSLPALTEQHLEAIRLWIHAGAPETGVVEGTAELLGSCLPEATPADIPQPPVPDPSVGTQLAMPGYLLLHDSETEGCIATYYDVSASVPASMMTDCPGAFPGTNETGLNAGKCFSYNGNKLYQDAQTHHSIVHIYDKASDWNDPSWGTWRCYSGATPDAPCDPTVVGQCGVAGDGTQGVCGTRFHAGVACNNTVTDSWGPDDFHSTPPPQFSGAQETTADFAYPNGVYGLLPLKGLVVWNSHAFNHTSQDTAMEGWINLTYTDQRTWPGQGLFNDNFIFTQNVPVFESREYCATHTFAEGTRLFQLTSHTHKHGVRWRYYAPPQTPCPGFGTASPSCTPGSPSDIFYESTDYKDPLTMNMDPPMHFTGTTNERTVKFCSVFDNGTPAYPSLIKQRSTSPVPTGGLIFGGPCGDDTVACMGGVNKGQLCHGNNSECPGSTCDACPLKGGVTTEDEMFIAIGTFYIDP